MIYKAVIILITSVLVATDRPPDLQKIPEPEARVFALINDFRASEGLPKLKYLKRKQWQVDLWARRISRRFEHADRGFTCENIASNRESPEALFYQWKNSPGHRRNMLMTDIRYGAIGVFVYRSEYFGVFRGYAEK